MYAIVAAGGKQYKVTKGDVLKIEKLDDPIDNEVVFDQVLMVVDGDNVKIGAPYVSGAKVVGKISDQGRGEKINIIKFRRRKHYMRRQGHRQYFTEVKIEEVKS